MTEEAGSTENKPVNDETASLSRKQVREARKAQKKPSKVRLAAAVAAVPAVGMLLGGVTYATWNDSESGGIGLFGFENCEPARAIVDDSTWDYDATHPGGERLPAMPEWSAVGPSADDAAGIRIEPAVPDDEFGPHLDPDGENYDHAYSEEDSFLTLGEDGVSTRVHNPEESCGPIYVNSGRLMDSAAEAIPGIYSFVVYDRENQQTGVVASARGWEVRETHIFRESRIEVRGDSADPNSAVTLIDGQPIEYNEDGTPTAEADVVIQNTGNHDLSLSQNSRSDLGSNLPRQGSGAYYDTYRSINVEAEGTGTTNNRWHNLFQPAHVDIVGDDMNALYTENRALNSSNPQTSHTNRVGNYGDMPTRNSGWPANEGYGEPVESVAVEVFYENKTHLHQELPSETVSPLRTWATNGNNNSLWYRDTTYLPNATESVSDHEHTFIENSASTEHTAGREPGPLAVIEPGESVDLTWSLDVSRDADGNRTDALLGADPTHNPLYRAVWYTGYTVHFTDDPTGGYHGPGAGMSRHDQEWGTDVPDGGTPGPVQPPEADWEYFNIIEAIAIENDITIPEAWGQERLAYIEGWVANDEDDAAARDAYTATITDVYSDAPEGAVSTFVDIVIDGAELPYSVEDLEDAITDPGQADIIDSISGISDYDEAREELTDAIFDYYNIDPNLVLDETWNEYWDNNNLDDLIYEHSDVESGADLSLSEITDLREGYVGSDGELDYMFNNHSDLEAPANSGVFKNAGEWVFNAGSTSDYWREEFASGGSGDHEPVGFDDYDWTAASGGSPIEVLLLEDHEDNFGNVYEAGSILEITFVLEMTWGSGGYMVDWEDETGYSTYSEGIFPSMIPTSMIEEEDNTGDDTGDLVEAGHGGEYNPYTAVGVIAGWLEQELGEPLTSSTVANIEEYVAVLDDEAYTTRLNNIASWDWGSPTGNGLQAAERERIGTNNTGVHREHYHDLAREYAASFEDFDDVTVEGLQEHVRDYVADNQPAITEDSLEIEPTEFYEWLEIEALYEEMEEEADEFRFFEFDAETGTITGYSNDGSRDVEIPSEIDGVEVTAIDSGAFNTMWGNDPIDSVTLPETLTEIGSDAFMGNNLTEIVIPDSVETLGGAAFDSNTLTSATIGSGVTQLPVSVFMNNELEEIVIPDSVETIGTSAFRGNNMATIEIPESVTTIEGRAFEDNAIIELMLPDSVVSVGNTAFQNNALESVTLSESLETIGTGAFRHNELVDVYVPDAVEEIGNNAFNDNPMETASVHVDTDYSTGSNPSFPSGTEIEVRTHFEFDADTGTITGYNIQAGGTDVVIPEEINGVEVTAIDHWAFETTTYAGDSNRISSVEIPDTVTTIGTGAFQGNRLETLVIPDSVTSISNAAFNENELTEVAFGEGLTEIRQAAFTSNNLTDVYIPDNVETVQMRVFQNNPLESASLDANTSYDERTNSLGTFPANTEIEIRYDSTPPEYFEFDADNGRITGYDVEAGGTDVVIPPVIDGVEVTTIGGNAFNGAGLTSVELPETLLIVQGSAFLNNELTEVVIPDNVERILTSAFRGNNLTELYLPDSVERVLLRSFDGNPLETVSIHQDTEYEHNSFPSSAEITVRSGTTGGNNMVLND